MSSLYRLLLQFYHLRYGHATCARKYESCHFHPETEIVHLQSGLDETYRYETDHAERSARLALSLCALTREEIYPKLAQQKAAPILQCFWEGEMRALRPKCALCLEDIGESYSAFLYADYYHGACVKQGVVAVFMCARTFLLGEVMDVREIRALVLSRLYGLCFDANYLLGDNSAFSSR